jgi:hypothetical protein
VDYNGDTVIATDLITFTNDGESTLANVHLSVIPHATGEWTLGEAPIGSIWENAASLLVPVNLNPGQSITDYFSFIVRPSANLSNDITQRLARANGIMQLAGWLPLVSNGHGVVNGDSQVTPVADNITVEYLLIGSMFLAAPGELVASSGPTACDPAKKGNDYCAWSRMDQTYVLTNARDLAFSVSPRYKVASGKAGNTPVRVFYTTGAGSVALKWAIKALNQYSVWYGAYPWPTYTIAQAPDSSAGDEWPAMATIGGNFFDAYVVTHEVAHQWWYGIVGDNQITNPWLDEAFAEFSSRSLLKLGFGYNSTLSVSLPATHWKTFGCNSRGCSHNSYGQTVYYKGAAFLHSLRSVMGETAFWSAMRAIQKQYRFKLADQAGVLDIFRSGATSNKMLKSINRLMRAYGFPNK